MYDFLRSKEEQRLKGVVESIGTGAQTGFFFFFGLHFPLQITACLHSQDLPSISYEMEYLGQ